MDPPPPSPTIYKIGIRFCLFQRQIREITIKLLIFGVLEAFFIVTKGKTMLALFYGVLHDLHSTPTFCKTLPSLPGARPVYELNVYQVAPTHARTSSPSHPSNSHAPAEPSPLGIRHVPIVSAGNSFGENFAQTLQVLTL